MKPSEGLIHFLVVPPQLKLTLAATRWSAGWAQSVALSDALRAATPKHVFILRHAKPQGPGVVEGWPSMGAYRMLHHQQVLHTPVGYLGPEECLVLEMYLFYLKTIIQQMLQHREGLGSAAAQLQAR